MLKKITFVLVVACAMGFCGRMYYTKHYRAPENVHIFLDHATIPTFAQMMNLVRLDKKDPKYIIWSRFEKMPRTYNIKERNMIQDDASTNFRRNRLDYYVHIHDIYRDHPNAKFYLHANINNAEYIGMMFKNIPFEQIEHVYLYEDGIGNTLKVNQFKIAYGIRNRDNCVSLYGYKNWKKWIAPMDSCAYAIDRLVPTTYYFSLMDLVEKNDLMSHFMQEEAPYADFEDLDLRKMASELTPEQLNDVMKMVGFNVERYRRDTQGKKVLLITTPWFYPNEMHHYDSMIDFIKNLKETRPEMFENTLVYLKQHPSGPDISKQLAKILPNLKILNKRVPVEVLALSNLEPDWIIGANSSLFFSFSPQKIAYYMTTKRDMYLPFLLELGIVSREKVIDLENYVIKGEKSK